jgi:hypothetical protein
MIKYHIIEIIIPMTPPNRTPIIVVHLFCVLIPVSIANNIRIIHKKGRFNALYTTMGIRIYTNVNIMSALLKDGMLKSGILELNSLQYSGGT